MDRRKFIIGTAALALVSRFATAADKKQYRDFIFKNNGAEVIRIFVPIGRPIPRAQIAGGSVFR